MFGYMTTDYSRVEMTDTQEIEVECNYIEIQIIYSKTCLNWTSLGSKQMHQWWPIICKQCYKDVMIM
jgi:hypothetical protein